MEQAHNQRIASYLVIEYFVACPCERFLKSSRSLTSLSFPEKWLELSRRADIKGGLVGFKDSVLAARLIGSSNVKKVCESL